MSFVPRQLNESEIASLQKEFLSLSQDPAKIESTWKELDAFFHTANEKDDQLYWNTFFAWYTSLCWKLIHSLENNFVLGVVVPRQIVKALLLGFDVFEDLTWYMFVRTKDIQDVTSFYTKLKQNIFTSSSIVGQFQGKNVIMSDVIKEIVELNRSGNDSLKVAEFLSKLKTILYKPEDAAKGFIYASSDDVVDRFFTLIHFFIGVEPKNIYYILDAKYHPEKYDDTAITPAKTEEVLANLEKEVAAVPEEIPAADASLPADISYEEIQELVNSKFAQDESGQYQDIEAVFDFLDALAEQYQDDRIKELLYFDETIGGFTWQPKQ